MTIRAHLDAILHTPADPDDGTGRATAVVFAGDLNDEPEAATTQIIKGSGLARPDRHDGYRMQNQLALLDGDHERLAALDAAVAEELGFDHLMTSVGQVYPRSLDFDVVSTLAQAAAAPSNLATTVRLMAGHELITEGFRAGQVGSSAMPHKMNTRSCERINGLAVVVRGQASMTAELAGTQWNEGDVSCSVVRRVALPDAFFAADGLYQTFLTVLSELGPYPAVIKRERTSRSR